MQAAADWKSAASRWRGPGCAGTGPPCEILSSEVYASPQEVTYQKEIQTFSHKMSRESVSITWFQVTQVQNSSMCGSGVPTWRTHLKELKVKRKSAKFFSCFHQIKFSNFQIERPKRANQRVFELQEVRIRNLRLSVTLNCFMDNQKSVSGKQRKQEYSHW